MLDRVKLTLSDVAVIVILWSMEFFNVWICALCAYTAFVFFAPEEQHNFKNNDLSIFIIQCLGALILAFLVDVSIVRKMTVSMIGAGMFAITPFIGLLTTMTNSLWSGIMMFWPCSILFITLPVTYCLMFNQKLYANCAQVRRIVSVLEMCNALIGWIVFITLPEEIEMNSRYSVVFMWVITIPLLVALLTVLDSIRRFVRGDFTIDKSVKSLIEGIRNDVHLKHQGGRSVRHVVLFTLMLLPSLSLSALGSTMEAVSDGTQAPDPLLKNLLFLFQLLVIPLIEVILVMTQMSDEKADYSILILAHVTNVVVLVLIVTNISAVSPVSAASDMERGPLVRVKRGTNFDLDFFCPEPGLATFLVLNGVNYDVDVDPSVILDDLAPKTKMASGQLIPGSKSIETKFDFQLHIRVIDPSFLYEPPEVTRKITLLGNRFHLLYIIGNQSFVDLKVFSEPHRFERGNALQLIVSTMWLDVEGSRVTITAADGSFKQNIEVPPSNNVIQTMVPVSPYARKTYLFTHTYTGKDELAKKLLNTDTVELTNLEEYTVNVVYLLLAGTPAELVINIARTCKKEPPPPTDPAPTTQPPGPTKPTTAIPSSSTQPPPPTKKPPKRDPPTTQEMTTYALAGSALGTTSVAYTHFFWMESPLRLRATMFASFRVANAVVWKLTPLLTGGKLTLAKAYALLSFQVLTTIAHFVLGWIFQSKFNRS